MNEEMYEEEDDDLPMQFRRINALHPGLAYSAFNERVNSYLAGQIGVRNYLHQAIYQANQANQSNQQYNNPFFNPMVSQQQNGQQQGPFQMGAPSDRANSHSRSASVATPQGCASQQQQNASAKSSTPLGSDGRRVSMPAASATTPGSRSATSKPTSPNQTSASPQSTRPAVSPSAYDQSMFPLTTRLPNEAQQLIDGQQSFYGVQPNQMTPGLPMPSMGNYSYNPNVKPSKRDSASGEQTGLNQTLSPFSMHQTQVTSSPFSETLSAATGPSNLEYSFGYDMFNSNGGDDFADSKFDFDFGGFGSGANTFNANNSGQVTPAAGMDSQWNPDDFFNYSAASD